MEFRAYHLPLTSHAELRVIAEHRGRRALAPALGAVEIGHICSELIAARAALLAMPTSRIIHAIDAAAQLLAADTALPALISAFSGCSEPMAALVLDRMIADWRAPALQRLVQQEFGSDAVLDGIALRADGSAVRATSPPLALHVFSGNVPGIAVTSIIRSLLVRSAVLGKSAAAEPVLAPAFARALHTVDAEIAACVAVTWWRGGDTDVESAALEHAGIVVHYGGAEAITSLRARAPAHATFIEHGPRLSFALLKMPVADGVAAELARAVALFDQQGCVSPQTAYVIGTREQARDFAAAVSYALEDLQEELPRGRIDTGEAAAVRELRAAAEFRAIGGADVELWSGVGLSYTVVLGDDVAFEGSCLNRTLIVKQAPHLDAVLGALLPVRQWLQTVGLAGFDRDERIATARRLADAGATRITRIADMPWPPPHWHHDGRGPLTELVRFVDVEIA